jgi:hypothetical protein
MDQFAVGDAKGRIYIGRVSTNSLLPIHPPPPNSFFGIFKQQSTAAISCLCFSPDGDFLFFADVEGTIQV